MSSRLTKYRSRWDFIVYRVVNQDGRYTGRTIEYETRCLVEWKDKERKFTQKELLSPEVIIYLLLRLPFFHDLRRVSSVEIKGYEQEKKKKKLSLP